MIPQNHETETGESDLTKNAFKILYATDDDLDAAAAAAGGEGAVEGQEPLDAANGGQVSATLLHYRSILVASIPLTANTPMQLAELWIIFDAKTVYTNETGASYWAMERRMNLF